MSLCLCSAALDTVLSSKEVIRIGDDAVSMTTRSLFLPEAILSHPIFLKYDKLESSIPVRETIRRFLKVILDEYTGAATSLLLRRDGITTKRKDFFPLCCLNTAIETATSTIVEELDVFIDTSRQDSEKFLNDTIIFEVNTNRRT